MAWRRTSVVVAWPQAAWRPGLTTISATAGAWPRRPTADGLRMEPEPVLGEEAPRVWVRPWPRTAAQPEREARAGPPRHRRSETAGRHRHRSGTRLPDRQSSIPACRTRSSRERPGRTRAAAAAERPSAEAGARGRRHRRRATTRSRSAVRSAGKRAAARPASHRSGGRMSSSETCRGRRGCDFAERGRGSPPSITCRPCASRFRHCVAGQAR